MLWEHERDYGFGMDALVIVCSGDTNEIMDSAWMLWSSYALGTRTELWFGHGCSGHRMLWAHERDYGFGMDALVSVCSGNANEIMVSAWMLWSSYALGTRTALWASARGARALGAGGAKLLVSPLIRPIVVPYIINYLYNLLLRDLSYSTCAAPPPQKTYILLELFE